MLDTIVRIGNMSMIEHFLRKGAPLDRMLIIASELHGKGIKGMANVIHGLEQIKKLTVPMARELVAVPTGDRLLSLPSVSLSVAAETPAPLAPSQFSPRPQLLSTMFTPEGQALQLTNKKVEAAANSPPPQ